MATVSKSDGEPWKHRENISMPGPNHSGFASQHGAPGILESIESPYCSAFCHFGLAIPADSGTLKKINGIAAARRLDHSDIYFPHFHHCIKLALGLVATSRHCSSECGRPKFPH
jgi:hypothetical protein